KAQMPLTPHPASLCRNRHRPLKANSVLSSPPGEPSFGNEPMAALYAELVWSQAKGSSDCGVSAGLWQIHHTQRNASVSLALQQISDNQTENINISI
ncbi:MAG: hypothetical protein ACTS10_22930, partial [Kiloniellales bacterium]